MTTSLIKTILTTKCGSSSGASGNHDNLYGFKMISGKEIIVSNGENTVDDSTWKLDETNGTIEFLTTIQTPCGPQIKIVKIIDVSDIAEVMIFYEPGKFNFGGITQTVN